ncbi:MAG: hypothetical protein RSB96_04145 [Oscillospiraceae bacterium]
MDFKNISAQNIVILSALIANALSVNLTTNEINFLAILMSSISNNLVTIAGIHDIKEDLPVPIFNENDAI